MSHQLETEVTRENDIPSSDSRPYEKADLVLPNPSALPSEFLFAAHSRAMAQSNISSCVDRPLLRTENPDITLARLEH